MAMTWDLTDVPTVAAADLAVAMQTLIEAGRGAVLLRGLDEVDLETVQTALQRRFHGSPQQALAAFVRFRQLVEVFSARRLKSMMLERGYAIIAPALATAAGLRLNAKRGFNPQQFTMALKEAAAANVVALQPHHIAGFEPAAQKLAA